MTNTKARHEEIYNAAVEILDEWGGVEVFDALPQLERVPNLREMAKEVVKMTSCHLDSAKRNIAKALRRARYGVIEAKWGGPRPGAGRPASKPKKIKDQTN